jgi:alanyl-tRNA synthetase
VQQQGSLVSGDRLRFDFTHFKDVTKDELDRVEELVNSYIIDNYNLLAKQIAFQEAKRQGALAFFAEKYESKVRSVSIGDVSLELCGGTHLDNTGQIGIFKIIQEGSIASGIRRIEAVTGKEAYKTIKQEGLVVKNISSVLSVPVENLTQELQKRLAYIKELEKQLNIKKFDTLKVSIENDIKKGEVINGINFITHIDVDMDSLRKAVDLIKEKSISNTIVASSTGTSLENKIFFVTGITQDLCDKGIDASKLIKDIAGDLGGSGGGRKDFAQAGGNKPENFQKVLQKLKDMIKNII